MLRCLQLAQLGAGHVAPNPMVGAVLVYNDRVIGEGYHQQYGQAHAEVNCINQVRNEDKELISKSTLYVSLEPCVHFGKTPPCVDLIIETKIPAVVIGCKDSFEKVKGRGIEKLKAAGIKVTIGILENECLALNKRFFTFYEQHRPYIILKWAQTNDGIVGSIGNERLFISNEKTNQLVHQWRTEEAAILVGTNTALLDDPSLTARLWPGNQPVRLVIDSVLKLPLHLNLFDGKTNTIVFNHIKQLEKGNLVYHRLKKENDLLPQIMTTLFNLNLQSVIVEGGAKLLQSFINAKLWDEARVITNTNMQIGDGVAAPVLKNEILVLEQLKENDHIAFFKRNIL